MSGGGENEWKNMKEDCIKHIFVQCQLADNSISANPSPLWCFNLSLPLIYKAAAPGLTLPAAVQRDAHKRQTSALTNWFATRNSSIGKGICPTSAQVLSWGAYCGGHMGRINQMPPEEGNALHG